MTREGRKILSSGFLAIVGIGGNSAADPAAKVALHGDMSVQLIPFSDLKSHTNIYIRCGIMSGMSSQKIYKIFPVLKECIVCPRTNRKEETVMAKSHIGHSFITDSFLLKGDCTLDVIDI